MTDPQQYVADQIGQQAESLRAPGSDIAQAVQASAGSGVTEVDVSALAAQIKALQDRVDAAEAANAADVKTPGKEHIKTLQHFLAGHGDPRAIELGNDLSEAFDAAAESGDGSYAAKASDRLVSYLARNRPYPGENYHYNNAVAFAADTADHIDALTPPAVPGKVLQGAVVG